MPDQSPRIHLSMTQVVASALASVTAAVLASFIGVAGTIIGAAVVSILATVGSAVYSYSLHRTKEGLRNVSSQIRDTPLSSRSPDRRRLSERLGGLRSIRWRNVGLAAAGVFVVTMGVITVVELAAGKPVAKIVGGSSPSGASTTIGGAFSGSGSSPQPSPQPSEQGPSTSTSTTQQPSGSTTTSTTPPTTTTTTPQPPTTVSPPTTAPNTPG